MTLKKRETIKAAERVAAQIRREIVTGNLRTGEKLLPENQLQEQFGISRPTLREALRMLEAESLINVARGRHGGATVTALDPCVLARQVGASLQREGTTLRDVWLARMVFEPQAAAMIAEHGSRMAIEELAANIDAAREAVDDPDLFGPLATRFGELLVEHCGNKTLRLLALLVEDIIRRQNLPRHMTTGGTKHRFAVNVRSREKLLRLIESGHAEEAETYWRNHLKVSLEDISAYRVNMPIDVLTQQAEGPAIKGVTRQVA
jgi:DNA-binding FadR family transcriptional regulator